MSAPSRLNKLTIVAIHPSARPGQPFEVTWIHGPVARAGARGLIGRGVVAGGRPTLSLSDAHGRPQSYPLRAQFHGTSCVVTAHYDHSAIPHTVATRLGQAVPFEFCLPGAGKWSARTQGELYVAAGGPAVEAIWQQLNAGAGARDRIGSISTLLGRAANSISNISLIGFAVAN